LHVFDARDAQGVRRRIESRIQRPLLEVTR
jgi:hypothetical protein